MNRQDVRAGLGERFQKAVGIFYHQVDVEKFLAMGPEAFDQGRAKGQIGDKVPVHNIQMDIVGSGLIDGLHLFAQTGKIGS
jgi:hypothetical protein